MTKIEKLYIYVGDGCQQRDSDTFQSPTSLEPYWRQFSE